MILEDICENDYLDKLRLFYEDYFESDKEYNEFLNLVFHNELNQGETVEIEDSILIPRKMLNTTMRLVSVANDIEQIRQGKDVFKIVFLVSCIETLQKLKGVKISKSKMVKDFFTNFISSNDKKVLLSKCRLSLANDSLIESQINQQISIEKFSNLINEIRNCAVHEGEYWDFTFKTQADDYWLMFSIGKLMYETKLEYREF